MSGVWRCGAFAFDLSRPLVMGIVNVTPDSFSDGGDTADTSSAVAAGSRHLVAGADILDVGGESTRPGSRPVDAEAEAARVVPVVTELARGGACVSADTRRAAVAAACVAAGASVINDVGGFRDGAMVRVAAGSDVGLVVMHMRGEPGTMQDAPEYGDVVAEVRDFLERQAGVLLRAGVARDRIALDPGIGFGKSTAHNLELLRRLGEIASLGYPVLIGVSRKRFIGEITGEAEPRRRVAGSVAAAVAAVAAGAAIVRAHDVAETVAALKVAHAIETGEDGVVDEDDDRAEYDEVEDPEALRRAEEAVSRRRPEEEPAGPVSDEPWVRVAWQVGPAPEARGLQDVVLALASEGIQTGWDPHDPLEPSPGPYALWQQGVPETFAVLVPVSQFARALEVLSGPPPAGVRYASPDEGGNVAATSAPRPPAATGQPRFAAAPMPTPAMPRGEGPALSDNARLEAAARPRAWTAFAAAVIVIAVILLVVVLLVTKG